VVALLSQIKKAPVLAAPKKRACARHRAQPRRERNEISDVSLSVSQHGQPLAKRCVFGTREWLVRTHTRFICLFFALRARESPLFILGPRCCQRPLLPSHPPTVDKHQQHPHKLTTATTQIEPQTDKNKKTGAAAQPTTTSTSIFKKVADTLGFKPTDTDTLLVPTDEVRARAFSKVGEARGPGRFPPAALERGGGGVAHAFLTCALHQQPPSKKQEPGQPTNQPTLTNTHHHQPAPKKQT
jgi:hypothetical protein